MAEMEEKWELPKKFDATDAEVLAANDAEQSDRLDRFKDTPIFGVSPRDRMRQIAAFEIEAAKETSRQRPLNADEISTMADRYAMLGMYHKAAKMNPKKAEEYQRYIDALNLPDDEWCEHPERHKYIKEYIWDHRHDRETTLLACNICGTWNAADPPEHLTAASRIRGQVRQEVKGMSTSEAKAYLYQRFGGIR